MGSRCIAWTTHKSEIITFTTFDATSVFHSNSARFRLSLPITDEKGSEAKQNNDGIAIIAWIMRGDTNAGSLVEQQRSVTARTKKGLSTHKTR